MALTSGIVTVLPEEVPRSEDPLRHVRQPRLRNRPGVHESSQARASKTVARAEVDVPSHRHPAARVSQRPIRLQSRRLTSSPATAANVKWCAPQSDITYPRKPFSPLRIWFSVRSFSHAHDALIWSVPLASAKQVCRIRHLARTAAAHDTGNTCLHGPHKRMHVDLVLRPVVDVRALMVAFVFLLAAHRPSATVPIQHSRTHLLM